MRDVAVELFQGYVARGETAPSAGRAAAGLDNLLADGKPAPAWFGLARKHMRAAADRGMDAVRESIGRGWAREAAEGEAALRKRAPR